MIHLHAADRQNKYNIKFKKKSLSYPFLIC